MRVRRLLAAQMAVLALTTAAACSEEDQAEVEDELDEAEDDRRRGAGNLGDTVEDQTDDLRQDGQQDE